MTQLIGVIGYPLQHSLSPVLQQAALDFYKLDMRYMLWETKEIEFPSMIEQLRTSQYLGASITVPYKEKVLSLIDKKDDLADLIGAVNTVVNSNGKLVGYNTDAFGFINALKKEAGFIPQREKVLILGAGGAARAVTVSLIQEGVDSLIIANRNAARSKALREDLMKLIDRKQCPTSIATIPWQHSEIQQIVADCGLIVNCTSIGMKYSDSEGQSPLKQIMIPPNALVYDLVYNPEETPLLISAKESGASVLSGLPMLVYQGAAAFELWIGREAPIDIMFSAVKASLEKLSMGEE